jgi:Lipocalin-like domain
VNEIVGEWRLLHWKTIRSDGVVIEPLGASPRGLLIYTAGGAMMVQMASVGRPKIDSTDALGGTEIARAQAYSTCLAYFGTYKVQGSEVIHNVAASLYPNWSDTDAARSFELTDGRLVLRTPPSTIGDITPVNEIAWSRITTTSASPN